MAQYLGRRLLLIVPTLWAVVTLVFVVVHLVPGNPAQVLLGPFATAAREASLRHAWGLDRPLIVQYLVYFENLVTGHLGNSYLSGEPVLLEIASSVPYTVTLGIAAILLAIVIGIPLGILAAVFKDSWIDRVALVASLLLISTPDFFLGILLLLVFAGELGWFPSMGAGTFGQPGGLLSHLVLPAIALSGGLVAYLARMTRTSMNGVLTEDYIRTARAKGVSTGGVVMRHAVRNALIPALSILGVGTGQVLGGTVVIETVFARPGLGTLLVNAITGRDYLLVQASVILVASLFVVINLVVDILYAVLDPRIEYS